VNSQKKIKIINLASADKMVGGCGTLIAPALSGLQGEANRIHQTNP